MVKFRLAAQLSYLVERPMRIAWAVFLSLLPCPLCAQSSPSAKAVAPACGPADAKFDVKTDKRQHPIAQPSEGKALVYFIEDDSLYDSLFKPTTRAGLDGAWTGATHGNSYFSFFVEPGTHHLCASWQSAVTTTGGDQTAAAHFTVQAGDVLYYRVRNIWLKQLVNTIELQPVDSDEAQLLMSKFRSSTSRPRT